MPIKQIRIVSNKRIPEVIFIFHISIYFVGNCLKKKVISYAFKMAT